MAILENLRRAYGAARLAMQDRRAAKAADSLLGISRYDAEHYWSRLVSRKRLIDLPYFSPWPELRPHVCPQPWMHRKNQIICMPGGWDRLSQQQRTHFMALAEATAALQSRNKLSFFSRITPAKVHACQTLCRAWEQSRSRGISCVKARHWRYSQILGTE